MEKLAGRFDSFIVDRVWSFSKTGNIKNCRLWNGRPHVMYKQYKKVQSTCSKQRSRDYV